jgi:hypothetical protein
MGNNASNVSAGKPKITGAIHVAPKGTELPQDATAALGDAWKALGYCSDAGVVNGTAMETTDIKAWGGDTVLVIQTSKDDTYKWTLIEIKNVEVLKFVYGESNVSGDLNSGIVIAANNKETDEVSVIIDMILSENTAKRIVIPTAKIKAVEDITYADNAAIGYGTTVGCMPDADGNTHYEYIQKQQTPSA